MCSQCASKSLPVFGEKEDAVHNKEIRSYSQDVNKHQKVLSSGQTQFDLYCLKDHGCQQKTVRGKGRSGSPSETTGMTQVRDNASLN